MAKGNEEAILGVLPTISPQRRSRANAPKMPRQHVPGFIQRLLGARAGGEGWKFFAGQGLKVKGGLWFFGFALVWAAGVPVLNGHLPSAARIVQRKGRCSLLALRLAMAL